MEPFSPVSAAQSPPAAGFVGLQDWNQTAVCGWLDLEIDKMTGALIHLAPTGSPRNTSWAAPSHPIALLQYQTLVEADLIAWRAGFLQVRSQQPAAVSAALSPPCAVSEMSVC